MDSATKQTVISAVIGGLAALTIAFAAKKIRCKLRNKRGGHHHWRSQSELITLDSNNMPAAIGPYTKGKMVKLSDGSALAWSSGQLGLDPKSNDLVTGEDNVVAQAEQVLKNLKALAEDNGFDLEKHTVKNTVYLTDMADFNKVNQVYMKYYRGGENPYPARTCIAINALPKGGLVEIESVFFKPAEQRK
ncbi:hypothetical protein FGO68_gene9159 [Halteria grandinella]|uniref:RidA family protein n=1 Tax=Halteria grandinella TaxID=5974 RepID=A0A8J8NI28_HALGN|nr:hypothetical protein FGO68_gene9159 [Halteria grandinella]